VSFSENVAGEKWEKQAGRQSEQGACPPDATSAIVDQLNSGAVDAVVTSGHATQYDWQIGYTFQSGQFLNHEGQLVGVDLHGNIYPVDSPNPKVYLASGNCLMGHIFDQRALALAWMRTAGVRQFVGYTTRTWYGYVGWKTWDYWVGSQGALTLAEAFFAAEQACKFELLRRFPGTVNFQPPINTGDHYQGLLSFAMQQGISDRDNVGLLWDRDAVAFYGDPAWEARVAPAKPPAWAQELSMEYVTETQVEVTVTVTATQNGALPRPVIAFLPINIRNIRWDSELDPSTVTAGRFFVVWHVEGELSEGDTRSTNFVATPDAGDSEIPRGGGS
jgi:zinc protease